MPVNLLGNVPKECQGSIGRNSADQGSQHFGRKILPLVDNYVAVTSILDVLLQFIADGRCDVIPVIEPGGILSEFSVAFENSEHDFAKPHVDAGYASANALSFPS